MKLQKNYLCIIVISILCLTILTNSQNYQISGSDLSRENSNSKLFYTDHDPIEIASDEDFQDYGFDGEGTFSQPYLIENLKIISPTDHAIFIHDTSKFFIIRNCYFETDRRGIYLINTADWTVRIYDNIFVGNNEDGMVIIDAHCFSIVGNSGYGDHATINLINSTKGYIANNYCFGGGNYTYLSSGGILLRNVNDTLVYDNYIDTFNRAIFTNDCFNLTIIQNYCKNSMEYAGIYLYYTHLSQVINNTCISNDGNGIRLYSSNFNLIKFNNISQNNLHGINLLYSGLNIIYSNNLIDNIPAGSSQGYDSTGDNLWFNLETKKGNYWSNRTTDYYIIDPGTNVDFYPLVSPTYIEEQDLDIILTDPFSADLTIVTEITGHSMILLFVISLSSIIFAFKLVKGRRKQN